MAKKAAKKSTAKKAAKPSESFEETLWSTTKLHGFVLANGSMLTNTKGAGEICPKMVENDLVGARQVFSDDLHLKVV